MSLSRTSQKSTDNKLVKTLDNDFPATLEPAESKKSAKSFFSSFFSQGGNDNEQDEKKEDKVVYSLNALENAGRSSSKEKPKSKSSSIFSALSFAPEEKKTASANANAAAIGEERASASSGSKTGIISSFIYGLQNLSWLTWLVIIVVLAFLGFNVFMYLAQTTQVFSNILAAILGFFNKLFGKSVVDTVQQTTNASAAGAQGVVDFASSAITSGINAVQQGVQNIPSSSSTGSNAVPGITSGQITGQPVSSTVPKKDVTQDTTLNTALNNASQSMDQPQQNPIDDGSYQADDSYSSIQKPTSKAGWCFIGEQQNFRSCVEVGDNDICMSGNIFPTQDVCVNPSLRV